MCSSSNIVLYLKKNVQISDDKMNVTKHIVILQICFFLTFSIDCISENGTAVDWWFIYKQPNVKYSEINNSKEYNSGLEYLYSDSVMPELIEVSDWLIDSEKSAFARTANQYYQIVDKQSIGYFFYNDAHINQSYNWSWGHSKGFGLFDADGGIFVPHSISKFPSKLEEYEYPRNAKKYGQNIFCISLKLKDLEKLGKAFWYTNPYFFDALNIPENLKDQLPSLSFAFTQKVNNSEPHYSIHTSFTRLGDVPFTIYAKSSQYGKDIVSDLMASHLKSHLISETWQHSDKGLSPHCTNDYNVSMVTKVSVADEVIYYNHNDHSKWAASNNDYFCIGDINRVESQFTRGGLYVCIKHRSLNENVKKLIVDYIGCN